MEYPQKPAASAALAVDSVPLPLLTRIGNGFTREFWRYFIVSVAALAADYGTLIGLTELLDVNYLISGAAGFLIGTGVVYLGSIHWVFENRRFSQEGPELFLFVVIGVGGLFVNEVALWLFTDEVGLHYTASKLVAAGISFTFNFVVRKYLLFR